MMCIKKCQALQFIQTNIKPKQNQSELNGLSCYMSIISQFFKDIIVPWDIQKNSKIRLPLKLIRKWPQEKKNSGRVRKWKEKGKKCIQKGSFQVSEGDLAPCHGKSHLTTAPTG